MNLLAFISSILFSVVVMYGILSTFSDFYIMIHSHD